MSDASLDARMAFIRANTRAVSVPNLPIRIYTADELTPLWEATEKDLARHKPRDHSVVRGS